jgi:hypothetical protein
LNESADTGIAAKATEEAADDVKEAITDEK